MFSPIAYESGALQLIDQRLLPHKTVWVRCGDLESVAVAIEDMVVRGAPAIGCTAAYGLAVDLVHANQSQHWGAYKTTFFAACSRLERTRPTAVNLFYAINAIRQVCESLSDDKLVSDATLLVEGCAHQLFQDDLKTCMEIGDHGAGLASNDKKLNVLTHCNAGALATAGYGTALGVVRSLEKAGRLEKVWVDETRPYLQGSRLTSYELQQDGIAHTLVVDSVAASLMNQGKVDWVVVGADRIAANGDTANKIGTYSLAVNAHFHKVKFFVAAPWSTVDFSISDGSEIPIEMRPADEVTSFGGHPIAADGIEAINPSFDVTPSNLISGIITEAGVIFPPFDVELIKARS